MQTRDAEQPRPAMLYVRQSLRILKRLSIMAAIEGVGAKQLHEVMMMSICATNAHTN
jgi:hypothetical protein